MYPVTNAHGWFALNTVAAFPTGKRYHQYYMVTGLEHGNAWAYLFNYSCSFMP
jgi:hypothetical protein